jgi:hypothetical protein
MALLEGSKVSKGYVIGLCTSVRQNRHALTTALGHTLAFVGLDVAVTWKQSEADSNVLMLFALTFGTY